LPNFSKIRCPTAEIILVEANHRGKRKHIQPSKLSTLRVGGCKKKQIQISINYESVPSQVRNL